MHLYPFALYNSPSSCYTESSYLPYHTEGGLAAYMHTLEVSLGWILNNKQKLLGKEEPCCSVHLDNDESVGGGTWLDEHPRLLASHSGSHSRGMSSAATGGLASAFPRPLGGIFHAAKDVKLVGIITSGYGCYSHDTSLGRKKKNVEF